MAVAEALLAENRLLGCVPPSVRADLARHMTAREFRFGDLVYAQDGFAEQVVFPLRGVFSLISLMRDGRGAEVATVGNEGVVGLGTLLRPGDRQTHRAIAQIPGDTLVVPADTFVALARRSDPLHAALLGYTHALITQIAQSSVCNRLHPVEQRCIRWLLQSHDRAGRDTFRLTQEFLGLMLGVGRQTVNATARRLQDGGLISYARGIMTIRDRGRLEQLACECYGRVRREFDALLGPAQNAG